MDRLRGERPRARRLRQGRDRPGHPHRAHADRRRRARRAAGADQPRLRPDRRQPGRGLHLRQLFDRGRRRLDPPGLRRGALAVPRPRSPRRCAARSSELSIEDGKFLRAGKDTGRDYWSMAGEIALERRATGTAPVKRPSTYKIVGKHLPRLDLPAKVAGAGFIHDIAPENVLHARVLRQPWRGAHLAALDESAVRKAAKAPIEIIREGEFVAFTVRQRARGDARGRSRAHAGAAGRAARRRPPTSARRPGSRRSPRATRSPTPASPAARRHGRVVEASYSRPFLTYGSIGPSCALAEFKDGALKVWSHSPGPGGAARLARPRARPARRAGQRVPPPGRRRLRPQHRRRRRLRRLLHRHAPSGPHRARAMVARGRVRRRPDQHRDGDHAPRRARRRQQARRLDDRNLEPAARPASRHERQLQPARRRGAAQRAAAQSARTTCPTSAAAAPPATRSRSTTCRATG